MKFEKYFIAISILVLFLFLVVQYTIYNNIEEQTIQNINERQLNQAQQAASGIQDYMNNVVSRLKFLTSIPEIVDLSSRGKNIIINYQTVFAEEIKGITRIDSMGKIIFTVPNKESVGKDVSYQEHIIEIKKTKQVVISDVFMAVQGFRTIAVHVPIFRDGRYDGTLSFLLSFDKIVQKYIENIRIRKGGYAWVVSEEGIEISSPFAGHIGKKALDIYRDFPEVISMLNKMLKGEQGTTTYHFSWTREHYVNDVINHAVYMPIPIGNTFWSIVVAVPEEELLSSIEGLKTKVVVITIALLTLYVICLYLIVRVKIVDKEQKRHQTMVEALKESELNYKTLFEANPAPTLIYDKSTLNILAVNNVFLFHYGYSTDEILSMRLPDLYPEEQKEAILNLVKGLRGYKNVGEWRHRRKDGSYIDIISCSNDIIYNGRRARVAAITDITEINQADEIKEASERQLSLIFDTVGDVLFLLSVEADDNFRFVAVNTRFLELTGLNREQVTGKLMEEVLPPSAHALVREKYKQAIRENKKVSWEEVSEYPTGTLYGAVTITPARNSAGICTHLIGSVHDITEIRHAEEEIRKLNLELEQRVAERTEELKIAKEKAESADYLKSAFLATMSHELRTPLNSIIGFTGILMKQIPGPLNSEQLKQLGMAKGSAQHLLELINDVLDISKIEAGELVVSIKKFDFAKMLQNVTSAVTPLSEKKNLHIIVNISEMVKDIYSDERRAGQVFLNLLNNAIKFTDKGYIRIECEANDKSIVTKVIDTGIGIKKEDINKLFKPFSQIDTGLTRNREGTGLGLSICYKLAEKLGWIIKVESELGAGSTFTVTIPVIK